MTPCIKFENSYRLNHSHVVLYFNIIYLKRCRGFWKVYNVLSKDKDYVKKTIYDVKIKYSCPVYNAENLLKIDNGIIQMQDARKICRVSVLGQILMVENA